MTETPTSEGAATQAKGQSRGRTAAMWALLVVAGLLLLLTSFAIWVNRVALNTDAFTATSSELLADDAIRGAVATRAVDQLYEAVDVQAEVEDQLPDDLKSLSGPAAAGLRQLSYEVVDRALEQPRLQSLFATAIEQAHKTLVNVLSGGGTVTDTSGGIVSLDLSQIVLEAADRIGIRSQVEDKLPESGKFIEDPSRVVVIIEQPRIAEEEEAGEPAEDLIIEEGAEPELIGKDKDDEAAAE